MPYRRRRRGRQQPPGGAGNRSQHRGSERWSGAADHAAAPGAARGCPRSAPLRRSQDSGGRRPPPGRPSSAISARGRRPPLSRDLRSGADRGSLERRRGRDVIRGAGRAFAAAVLGAIAGAAWLALFYGRAGASPRARRHAAVDRRPRHLRGRTRRCQRTDVYVDVGDADDPARRSRSTGRLVARRDRARRPRRRRGQPVAPGLRRRRAGDDAPDDGRFRGDPGPDRQPGGAERPRPRPALIVDVRAGTGGSALAGGDDRPAHRQPGRHRPAARPGARGVARPPQR